MTTIPGGGGSVITFSVSGGASGNYAQDFANAIATATSISILPNESTVVGALNEFFGGPGSPTQTVLTTGGQYTYIATGSPFEIDLNASNETLLVGALVTVKELGNVGGERVTFADGNNSFIGSATGVGMDTITSGTGNDSITTGGGPSTVFAEGNALITLNDTTGGDVAVVQAGYSTIGAFGADTIFASAASGTFSGFALFNQAGGTPTDVTLGTGSVQVDGSNAAGGFYLFADASAADAPSISDTIYGGSGYDYFSTGTGSEAYIAGPGIADFEINSVAGGNITISDWGAGDSVNFAGESVATETALISSNGTVSGGNLTVTLGNGTTVEFVGVTSLTGHLY